MAQSIVPPPSIGAARYPSLTFTLSPSVPKFGLRVGRVELTRDGTSIALDTPNIIVGTSRGVVPHLSRDHIHGSDAIRWINVPFESFLEQSPPVPTLQNGPHPLHAFLGFGRDRHITSLCLRNPLDMREMPPNGNTFVSAICVRGVKKVTPSDWRNYVYKTRPDVVFALTDTPFTPPPYSQKRITKSIERSAAWLADLLRPPSDIGATSEADASRHPLNVFVHMAGGTSLPAREAFGYGLRETLHGPEAEAVKPLRCLDEGVCGYAFDLAALRGLRPTPTTPPQPNRSNGFLSRESPEMVQTPGLLEETLTPSTESGQSLAVSGAAQIAEPSALPHIASLLQASLGKLSVRKPRLVTGAQSPHEMLRLIRDVGVDLFDAGWAIDAAGIGIALDFAFPVPVGGKDSGRRRLGHNLFDMTYTHQFGRLADMFAGAGERVDVDGVEARRPVCLCVACSPRSPSSHILHSAVDEQSWPTADGDAVRYEKPYTRAYIHHLLHTHEMSAHSFLVAHNLAVLSAFLAGVRGLYENGEGNVDESTQFALEVERFNGAYDESEELFDAAKKDWKDVDKARGKGRLMREGEKQGDDD